MHFSLIIPIHSISLEPNTVFKIDNHIILSNNHQIPIDAGLLNEDFIREVGFYFNWMIGSYPFLFIQHDIDEEIGSVAAYYNGIAYLISNCLWFIKDNSITNVNCFIQNINKPDKVAVNQRGMLISDAKGNYQQQNFNNNELLKLRYFVNQYFKIQPSSEIGLKNSQRSGQNGEFIRGIENFIPHNKMNRIFRSFHFITNARINSFLPMKISSYVAAMECLFANKGGGSEISHQVSERIALFLGNSIIEKKQLYDAIKLAYNIRSRYLHGDVLSNKESSFDYLTDVSTQCDNIARDVFSKVFQNVELFLSDDNVLKAYFKDLIFK